MNSAKIRNKAVKKYATKLQGRERKWKKKTNDDYSLSGKSPSTRNGAARGGEGRWDRGPSARVPEKRVG